MSERLFWDSYIGGTYVKQETIERKRKENPSWNPPSNSPANKDMQRRAAEERGYDND